VAGKQLLRDGKLTGMDEKEILNTAKSWGEKINYDS
jgi:hypothetical protein